MDKIISILIIDDDDLFSASLSDFIAGKGYKIFRAADGRSGIDIFKEKLPCIVLLDQKLPDINGIEVCRKILEIDPNTKIIFITAYATIQYAVDAMQAGAFNYLSKPFELDELLISIDLATKNLKLEGKLRVQNYEREKRRKEQKLIGSSKVMSRINEQIQLAAGSEATVLITGRTGVGKNEVARAIHNYQGERETFLTINCSAIPENLIEAEYFGHEKGVFTGADSRREGIFELADGGTLVLDEIGEIPIHLQSKLLSVLEDKCIRRIGSVRIIPVDVRIIATTNQNLEKAIQEKRFRQDLYYRLAVFNLHIPPLNQHPEDIPQIADYFVKRLCKNSVKIPDKHMKKLMKYPWPGNVRELRNVIERSSFLFSGDEIRPADLLLQHTDHFSPGKKEDPEKNLALEDIIPLEEMKKRYIKNALKASSGNKSLAARTLDISLSTLKRKLKEMGVS